MTAIVLPDLNQKTIDDLRERVSKLSDIDFSKIDLSKIEMPALQDVGKSADQAIDRLLGRSRMPMWPWIAAGIGLIAVIGAITAWFTVIRRSAWFGAKTGWQQPGTEDGPSTLEPEGMTTRSPMADDLRAADLVTSLGATSYPIEEA
jgi:hypothetical protein